jgi:hypothetical protein
MGSQATTLYRSANARNLVDGLAACAVVLIGGKDVRVDSISYGIDKGDA